MVPSDDGGGSKRFHRLTTGPNESRGRNGKQSLTRFREFIYLVLPGADREPSAQWIIFKIFTVACSAIMSNQAMNLCYTIYIIFFP